VRVVPIFIAIAAIASAQNEKTMYTTDLNGNRVAAATSESLDDTHRQLSESINGRTVPLESTETHTLSKSGNRTVTETITKRYGSTGELASTQRTVTDTESLPNGSSNQSIRVYSSDVNGSMKETERQEVQKRVQGSSTTTETVLQRPDISGSFATSEKRSARADVSGNVTNTAETVYRRSQNGDLYPALQQVKIETRTGKDTVSEQVAYYEPGVTGKLQLARQTVSTSVTDAAGNETKEVNLYAASAYGRVQEEGAASQQISEQQLITRHVRADGGTTETLSVRRPSLSDPHQLGSPQLISETVCTGNCKP
jgi:hypothetical protein